MDKSALSKVLEADQRLQKSIEVYAETVDRASPENTKSGPWPVLKNLPSALRPVPSMPSQLLPGILRPWLEDITERFQCPPEFPAVGTMVALASHVGRRIGIRPKREDDWIVIPNLWGGVIGRPGIMKSPALAEAMKPLLRLEAKAHEVYDTAAKEFETKRLLDKVKREAKVKEAAREKDPAKQELLIREAVAAETGPPVAARYIVNDPTVEKLGELLNQNPRGLLLFRDELSGWLKTLDREGHENDRAFYLEAWNGTGRYTYDRIGRGTLHIEAACVSVLGGIQPGPLVDYLRAAVRGGLGDDGLIQRFQLLVYPDAPRDWKNIDRPTNREARDRVYTIFENLDRLNPKNLGATCEDGEIPYFRFTPDAQGFFDEWRQDLETAIRADDEHPVMEAHLSKYRSLMPSLALLFHLVDIVPSRNRGPVTKQAAELAAAWCDFLEQHARRIYQTVTERYQFAARLLGGRIKAGKLPDPFTARDVYLKGWGGLSNQEDVEGAAVILEDAGWIKGETILPGAKGGRSTVRYSINPVLKVLKVPDLGDSGLSEVKQ